MGGAGYARTSLKIPKNSEYRLRLLYYMESSGENCSVRISGDNESLRDMDKNLKGNFPLYINLDPESGESELFCMAEGVLTNLMSAPLDEWNELSVVVDSTPANGCIRSISLNDDLKEFGDGELPVEERYLDKDIDMLEIAMVGDAIFYVDNLTVSSGSVPEPWLFTLTAAVCLLLKRSRKLLNVS